MAQDTTITLLAIYTPNPPRENKNFWKKLTDHFNEGCTPQPNITLGDFNIVEEATDCFPPHPDPPYAETALRELKAVLEQVDGWQCTNPNPEQDFTFDQQMGGSRSRID